MLPVGIVAVVLIVLVALAIVLVTAKASLEPTDNALAKVGMPLGGGKIVSVAVIGGRERSSRSRSSATRSWPRRPCRPTTRSRSGS
jgi:hypothetical protein